MSETSWSDPDIGSVGMGEPARPLPEGTVTLLLADVEGSTRLWDSQPEAMRAAVTRLDRVLDDAVAAHGGVRPVEQGEGDSFVIAFARASDAVACALELQRAPLAPIKLRVGVHTGEVHLRDEGNYIGPTINRAARLRDLAHGGQTVLSGTAEPLVVEQLPPDVTLTDLGVHPLRDLPRPERVVQMCHPDLHNQFPPLRTAAVVPSHHLPVHLTSFVGRQAEIDAALTALSDNRLVTLTGAGGVGKTRLAVQAAGAAAGDYGDGVYYVDLAPVTHPDVVPAAAARALGLPDQPGQSTVDTLARFLRQRHMLLVLDNCEHLLDASAALAVAVLSAAPKVRVLATSREPIGAAGEATWHVPSMALDGDAIELFTDRARLARADFDLTDQNVEAVTEICRRLDGMPLAIELAAARVRALSLNEIRDSLHDRFRLLTGGSRTAVRRQQTLRASVDWSHALLTDTERILFRRLAAFLGGFDLDAAQAVAGADGIEYYQVLDQLTLLVDKSLVVAENASGATRYRLLETVRQYALEKLGESGEADGVRSRHRDHYSAMAALLDAPARDDYASRLEQAAMEMDNLRSAFGWSLENEEFESALNLASALQPVWYQGGRMREGHAWFDAAVAGDIDVTPAVHVRALADKAVLDFVIDGDVSQEQVRQAVVMARELGDAGLLARALTASGFIAGAGYDSETARTYYAEAADLARRVDDRWRLCQILTWQANTAVQAGDPNAARIAAEEGLQLAEAIGDRPNARGCRVYFGWAMVMRGELDAAVAYIRETEEACRAAQDSWHQLACFQSLGTALVYQGEVEAARLVADAALVTGAELGGYFLVYGESVSSATALASGDLPEARRATDAAARLWGLVTAEFAAAERVIHGSEIALTDGDLVLARRWADDAAPVLVGWHRAMGLATRARIAIAQGEPDQAARDAHEALTAAADSGSHVAVPDALELLARLKDHSRRHDAVRLLGAADAMRRRIGSVRMAVHRADHDAAVAAFRGGLGDDDFGAAWAEGAALTTAEAISFALRGRGERKRADSGWEALTPAELDVVRLVCEGLGNKEVAARLFISPRTVQAHLTHVYTKLGVSSRVQLARSASERDRTSTG